MEVDGERVVADDARGIPLDLGPVVITEVNALVTERNGAGATINWQFNTRDARTKLHRLYPFDSKHD